MGPVIRKEPWPRFTGSSSLMIDLAILSYGLYAVFWNAGYALLIMVSLLIHEMGHVWALWHYGLKVKGIYAIPPLGAAVITRDTVPSRMANIVFVLMGPAWGYAGAAATFVIYWITGSPIFAGMAGWMAILNLANLLPILPLDGGHAWRAIISPLPKALRITLMGAPLLAVLYPVIQANAWPIWLMYAAGVLATAAAVLAHLWRARDRRRIVRSLHALLGAEEATSHAVGARIEALLYQVSLYAAHGQTHPLFRHPGVLAVSAQAGRKVTPLSHEVAFLLCVTHAARQARIVFRVGERQLDATSDDELDGFTLPVPFHKSPLGVYLADLPEHPPLPRIKAVTALVGYGLLAFGLTGLLWHVRGSPGAFDALLDLMTR